VFPFLPCIDTLVFLEIGSYDIGFMWPADSTNDMVLNGVAEVHREVFEKK